MVALTDWPGTQQNNLPSDVAGNENQPEAAKDTVLIYKRNLISDFTFYDKTNVITRIDPNSSEVFPFTFVENNREINASLQERLIKELKEGAGLPEKSLQKDWAFGVLFVSILLFTLVSITSKSLMPAVSRFFLFKGINDFLKKDSRGLSMWQGLALNIATFNILALFCYSIA